MKKLLFLVFGVVLVTALTGCGKQLNIDQLDNGQYHYKSEALGFKIDLPKEFENYQVQVMPGKNEKGERISDWQDLEIGVPTLDKTVPRMGDIYAKIVTIRVYEAGKYKEAKDFEKLIEGNERSYAIKFWDKPAYDWSDKWTLEMLVGIKKSLQVIK